jgi:Fe-S cluster assembly protein SufD
MTTSAMTDKLDSTETFGQPAFDRLLEKRIDPTWLTSKRKEAWEIYQSIDWPNPRDENWMRSDIRGLRLSNFAPNIDESVDIPEGTPVRLLEGVDVSASVRSVNGVVVSESLDETLRAQGVVVGSLSRCARDHSALVERYLHSLISPKSDRFAALQAAMWSDGYFIYVPRNVRVEKPIHLHAAMADGQVDLSHTLIVLESGAEATVLFESSSPDLDAKGLHCGGIELIQHGNSHLRFVNLQDWGKGTWHFAHQRASVGRDAQLQWTVAAMGAKFAQVDQRVELVEPGARSQVNGVLFTQDRQHLVYNTLQHHKAPHCISDFLYKSVLQDRSRTVWRGMIKVSEGAQKTDGYQRNDNLMLSDSARADSIPGLEINADDVRCTHGSTSGRVDEELIFYAQSRGFTRSEAIRMIVTGFFQQIFDRITIQSVREALGAAIARQVRQYE